MSNYGQNNQVQKNSGNEPSINVSQNYQVQSYNSKQKKLEESRISLNDYRIIKVLGTGTFGTVSLAEKLSINKRVAIKEIYLNQTSENEVRDEFNIIMMFTHDRIIKVYEMLTPTPDKMTIILEYCEGGSLREVFEKNFNSTQNFKEDTIKKWIYQILDGLSSLHSRRIIHRDIKPDNIMFDKDQNIKIIDFGTSKYTSKKIQTNTLKGSPMFIAPEILIQDQNQNIDGKVDVYSVGIILYVLCFKKYPYVSNNPLDVRNDIISGKMKTKMFEFKANSGYSEDLKYVYEKMVALDPKERLTSHQLLDLPYFKNDKNLGALVCARDHEWIDSVYQKILMTFYSISERPLAETKKSLEIYMNELKYRKYIDSFAYFACHATLIDIYGNECLHLKVKDQYNIINNEIPKEFLETQLSNNNMFTVIYYTRMLENRIKLKENYECPDNFQKLINENLNNVGKSNQYSLMLIYEALSYSYYMNCEFEKCFDYIQKALQSSKNIIFCNFALDIAHLHNLAGIVYSKFGYEPLIEQYFIQSINIRDNINPSADKNPLFFGSCYFGSYINLGNFYQKTRDYVNSKLYYEKALNIYLSCAELQLTGLNYKIFLYIEICNLYIDHINTNSNNSYRNSAGFHKLIELSIEFYKKDLLMGIEFLNSLGIYFASYYSMTRALEAFHTAFKLSCELKFIPNIILNNIGVLCYIYGDNFKFPKSFNEAFINFNIDDLSFKRDERYAYFVINFLNYSMIQGNTKSPQFMNGLIALESFTNDFKKYFNISRKINDFPLNPNKFIPFNCEKYSLCLLTILNSLICYKRMNQSENIKNRELEFNYLESEIFKVREDDIIINLLNEFKFTMIILKFMNMKNQKTPQDDETIDKLIQEFLNILTIREKYSFLDNSIYFEYWIYWAIFCFINHKINKKIPREIITWIDKYNSNLIVLKQCYGKDCNYFKNLIHYMESLDDEEIKDEITLESNNIIEKKDPKMEKMSIFANLNTFLICCTHLKNNKITNLLGITTNLL